MQEGIWRKEENSGMKGTVEGREITEAVESRRSGEVEYPTSAAARAKEGCCCFASAKCFRMRLGEKMSRRGEGPF
jgi:hypothetical protein